MRASEAEREAVVQDLRRHAAVGRLDLDDLEQRVEAAFVARTQEQLAELTADLPAVPVSDFREHLQVFLAVQLLLVAIWALTGAGYFWPVWPFLGWGIGVVVHGVCDPGRQSRWSETRKFRTRGIAS